MVVQWFHRLAQTMILPERVLADADNEGRRRWQEWAQWPLVCLVRELLMAGWSKSQIVGAYYRAWARRPVQVLHAREVTAAGWAEAYDWVGTWLHAAIQEAAGWMA